MIAARILVPNLPRLTRAQPGLVIEIVSEPRNTDLTRREADLAIRFSRPSEGGLAVKARKLGALEFGVFEAAGAPDGDQPWITYEDASSALPQARWTETLRKEQEGPTAPLRVINMETALAAAACGVGRAVLPILAGGADPRLRAVAMPARRDRMMREVWLLSDADQEARLSVAAAKNWLTALAWA